MIGMDALRASGQQVTTPIPGTSPEPVGAKPGRQLVTTDKAAAAWALGALAFMILSRRLFRGAVI